MDQLVPLFAIGVGIATAIVIQFYIIKTMRRAFSPRWSQAELFVRILKQRFGVKAKIHSVDAVGIIRLLILTEPLTVPFEEIRVAFERDIRAEADAPKTETNKPKLILAVLPGGGKPHKAKAAPSRPIATPALQPAPTR